jgi:hypothetical protein
MAMKKKAATKSGNTNSGNNQQGRQQGHNTGQTAWKSNIKPQTRNDPGAPKTTGPEKKEQKDDFQKRG